MRLITLIFLLIAPSFVAAEKYTYTGAMALEFIETGKIIMEDEKVFSSGSIKHSKDLTVLWEGKVFFCTATTLEYGFKATCKMLPVFNPQ